MLGWLHAKGLGIARDVDEEAAWYRRAADPDVPMGQHNLGKSYLEGEGVSRGPAQARRG